MEMVPGVRLGRVNVIPLTEFIVHPLSGDSFSFILAQVHHLGYNISRKKSKIKGIFIMLRILLITLLSLFTTACAFAAPPAANSPAISKIDLTAKFDGFNGTAVFYTPDTETYYVHNKKLSEKRSSPCSTFKIFAMYVGLVTGNIDYDNSLRKWNGTHYWYDAWNQDVDLAFAYKNSCVWYFRRAVNDIGYESMQSYIDQLDYGNKDISDWAGVQNTNETLLDLKGFWIESSIKISPVEQTQVLHRIFTSLAQNHNDKLATQMKQIMLTTENADKNLKIYGKTGFGRVNGENTDAWFVGMYEANNQTVYYAVRLDDPLNPNSTSAKAKEIAINIINDNYKNFI